MNLGYAASLPFYLPELLAIATLVFILFSIAFTGEGDERDSLVNGFVYFGLLATLIFLVKTLRLPTAVIFFDALVVDSFATVMKIVLLVGTIASIYLGTQSVEIDKKLKAEFAIMAISIMIGGMLLISANNFLTLYLGVETLSILSYVLAAFNKYDERSSEAGIKYALYGGLSAGIMLFGMAHVFGVFGTIDFTAIAGKIPSMTLGENLILLPSFLLFFVGLAYKIAAVPFHMWSPDVYEGSPTPVTTFFSIVPKLAGLAAVMRVSYLFFSSSGFLAHSWGALITVIAALTMTVGNISAINQRSVKRMLAYSSISHSGFMLAAILTVGDTGIRALLFYGVGYLFMTLVAFYITAFVADRYGNDHFERFDGLIKRYPVMALMMILSMLSLAGIPPFIGFIAKFNVLAALVEKRQYTLAVVAVVNSVISLYYYLKIVRGMVFKGPESVDSIPLFTKFNQGLVVCFSLPILVLGIYWSEIISFIGGTTLFVLNK